MATRIVLRPCYERPRKRVRSRDVVARYWAIRQGLLCEWCQRRRGTELNHILHGQNKEDAPWNFQILCHECHQDPVTGFHGSRPDFSIEDALRKKREQGFSLPREAYAYLEGVDHWPMNHPDPEEGFALAERIAEQERSGRGAW